MITNLKITNFKSIEHFDFKLAGLTVLTGKNSTGKSSVIQSILLACQFTDSKNYHSMRTLTSSFAKFSEVRNKHVNAKNISVVVTFTPSDDSINKISLNMSQDLAEGDRQGGVICRYENEEEEGGELFYLSANRIGQESVAISSDTQKAGLSGEYLFSTFEQRKFDTLHEYLCVDKDSLTLAYQLNYWLSEITGIKSALKTENVGGNIIKVLFDSDDLQNIDPINLGAGFSYLAKVLIICLIAKKGDVVIIENPEIHLHPKSQAMLALFFSFIVKAGIQLIIETHCEHLINKFRYQVSIEEFSSNDIVIYYKESSRAPFDRILINDFGHFENEDEQRISFPSGFFDQSVQDLLSLR